MLLFFEKHLDLDVVLPEMKQLEKTQTLGRLLKMHSTTSGWRTFDGPIKAQGAIAESLHRSRSMCTAKSRHMPWPDQQPSQKRNANGSRGIVTRTRPVHLIPWPIRVPTAATGRGAALRSE